jgi:hypothetical protein
MNRADAITNDTCWSKLRILTIAVLLASCGGGADTTLQVELRQSDANRPLRTGAALQPEALMDWAAANYPQFFNGTYTDGFLQVLGYGNFFYRTWASTGNYIGVLDGNVYIYGPLNDYQVGFVAPLTQFTCQVAECSNVRLGQEPDYESPIVKSSVGISRLVPEASQRSEAIHKSSFYRYGYLRGWAVVDINQDGLDDLVVAPTFYDQKPDLPVEVWINQGDGTFKNQTSDWVTGAVTKTALPQAMLVADFNGDGHPDIFISDSGQELSDCTIAPCVGAINRLMLSDSSGKLQDKSSNLADNAALRFNHVVTGVGDVNGDGRIDIAVPNLGESSGLGDGVIMQSNQGGGLFVDQTTQWLSDEIAYLPYSYQYSGQRPTTYDKQVAGTVALLDVNGDGRSDLVSCSYNLVDRFSRTKTVRISTWNATHERLEEISRFEMAEALRAVHGPTTDFLENDDGTLGCSGVWVADFDGDGTLDLMLQWERWDDSYTQLLKGLGDWKFEDVTVAALGSYRSTFMADGYLRTALTQRFQDVNGDGMPDIVITAVGANAELLAGGLPIALINDGHGKFTRQALRVNGGPVTKAQVIALTGCDFCSHSVFFGRFLRRADSNKALDMLLVNLNEDLYTDPVQERSVTLRVLKAR